MSNSQDLQWLVERRSLIQSFLLRLYRFLDGNNQQIEPSQSLVPHLLLGAGFSLWRSVFLADHGRNLETIDEHAKEFLHLLIKDNAINYPQDAKTRAWTVGYYINNAYFRLDLAYERLPLTTSLAKTVTAFLNEQRETATAADAIEAWDNAHAAAVEILEKLSNDG